MSFSVSSLFKCALTLAVFSGMATLPTLAQQPKQPSETQESAVSIEFSVNQVHGLFNFIQALSGSAGGSSPTLTEIFQQSSHNNQNAQNVLNQYRTINTSYDYAFNEELKGRHNSRQIWQLLTMASTQSTDINDFQQRTFGLLTSNDHKTMMFTMNYFAPIYDELIWQPSQQWLHNDLTALSKAAHAMNVNHYFSLVKTFYQTDWNNQVPFKVYLAPIPTTSGMNLATPQGNIVAFTTVAGQDPQSQLSIVFHELVHILFENQSIAIQKDIENTFLRSQSPYRIYAYQLLDEALATAIGNGWFYKKQRGELDPNDWYHTPYINQQAKSVLPLIEQYLNAGNSIDDNFIASFIEIYERQFPNSHLDVQNIFSNTSLLIGAELENDNRIFQAYFENLQFLRSINVLAPLDDLSKINEFKDSINTRLIIVSTNHQQHINALTHHFPWLKNIKAKNNFIATHYAQDGAAEILFVIDEVEQFSQALKTLVERKTLSENLEVIEL